MFPSEDFFPYQMRVHSGYRRGEPRGRRARRLEPYRSDESQRLCPLIGQEGFVVSIDGGLMLCSLISGAEGAVFSKSVETPHVRAEPFKELR